MPFLQCMMHELHFRGQFCSQEHKFGLENHHRPLHVVSFQHRLRKTLEIVGGPGGDT